MKPEDLSGFHVGWDSWTRTITKPNHNRVL
nr:MAG TPA: hypothetical protein [Caudoviricetes sp.]